MLDSTLDVEYSEGQKKDLLFFLFWGCVRKKYVFVGKMALFCVTAPGPMASCPFEGIGTSDAGK